MYLICMMSCLVFGNKHKAYLDSDLIVLNLAKALPRKLFRWAFLGEDHNGFINHLKIVSFDQIDPSDLIRPNLKTLAHLVWM